MRSVSLNCLSRSTASSGGEPFAESSASFASAQQRAACTRRSGGLCRQEVFDRFPFSNTRRSMKSFATTAERSVDPDSHPGSRCGRAGRGQRLSRKQSLAALSICCRRDDNLNAIISRRADGLKRIKALEEHLVLSRKAPETLWPQPGSATSAHTTDPTPLAGSTRHFRSSFCSACGHFHPLRI